MSDDFLDDEAPEPNVTLRMVRSLKPSEEPSEFMFDVNGVVDLDTKAIGWVDARVVEAGRAFDRGEPLFDVCDSVDQSRHDYASVAYDFNEYSLKESIADGTAGSNLLIVESIMVAPEHRRRGLGLLAMLRTIDTFQHGCGAVIIQPFPMQFSAGRKKSKEDPLELHRFTTSKEESLRRLRRYWKRIGLKRVGKTDFFALDLAFRRPSTSEVLKAARATAESLQ